MRPIHSNPFAWASPILGALAVMPFFVLSYLDRFVGSLGFSSISFVFQGGLFLTPIAGLLALLTGLLGIIRMHSHPGSAGNVAPLMGTFLGVIALVLYILFSPTLAQAAASV